MSRWPWNAVGRRLAELLDESHNGVPHPEGQLDTVLPGELLLLAPAPHDRSSPLRKAPAGVYSVELPIDFEMTEELLCAAAATVTHLSVRFAANAPPLDGGHWLFQLRSLRALDLSFWPFETLPEALGELGALEHLYCYGSHLVSLPRSIGRLTQLKELDCYTSYDLHFLPAEVLYCWRLDRLCGGGSRFSTRALYNNSKNQLALPAIGPWWQAGSTQAPSRSCVRALLLKTVAWEACVDLTLSYVAWNFCSVCGVHHAHDAGCRAWAHQVVATDRQALLFFCCGWACAQSVKNQVWFNPATLTNEPIDEVLDEASPEDQPSCDEVCLQKEPFEEKHIQPWDHRTSPLPSFLTRRSDQHSVVRVMQVVAAGDYREAPDASSPQLGRLRKGTLLRVARVWTDTNGRPWARFNQLVDDDRVLNIKAWTALTKKNGTAKLQEHGVT